MKNRERTGLRRGINRRQFLAAATAGWAGVQVLPARVLGRDGTTGPGGRITVGVIGTGSRGTDHARSLLGDGDVQLIAVCDANRSHAEKLRKAAEDRYAAEAGKGSWKGCLVTRDFREVLGRDDLDAVFIAAPESWHAIMSIEAMKAGKDVYCEKALALTVAEGRAVCDAVRRYGRVFQAGTQQRSDPRFRFACELARNGHLGSLKTVTVGVPGGRALPVLPVAPVPADLDYDLWLGPAPFKPYREGLCSYNWYFVTDYCAGWIQSWGVHHVDIALWGAPALATATLEVEGTATFPEEGTGDASYAWDTRCVTREGLTLHFCSDDRSPFGHGCRFEGERGWVHVDRGRLFAEPASLLETVSQVKKCDLAGSQKPVLDLALETTRAMGDPARARALASLLAALKDADASVASAAGRALAAVGGADMYPQIVAVLSDATEPAVGEAAAAAVSGIGRRLPDAAARLAPIASALAREGLKPEAACALLRTLPGIGGAEALAVLGRHLGSTHAAVRQAALRSLAEWPDPTALEPLFRAASAAPGPARSSPAGG